MNLLTLAVLTTGAAALAGWWAKRRAEDGSASADEPRDAGQRYRCSNCGYRWSR